MLQNLRESGKRTAGWLLSRSVPRYRYRHCLFVLAHMRCGSTALSNVLCSRPEVSGYGEAHVGYHGAGSPGQLAVNQMRRGGWKPQARILFDKILHSRHDRDAPPDFFQARAIFVVRRPGDSIASIVRLFAGRDGNEYATPADAASYYVERLATLEHLWRRFPAERRIGLSHEALLADPDHALAAISLRLGFLPALENRYVSLAASRRGGGGDPWMSGRHTRIVAQRGRADHGDAPLDLPPVLAKEARERFARLAALFSADDPRG